jgi:hypothetical protein
MKDNHASVIADRRCHWKTGGEGTRISHEDEQIGESQNTVFESHAGHIRGNMEVCSTDAATVTNSMADQMSILMACQCAGSERCRPPP